NDAVGCQHEIAACGRIDCSGIVGERERTGVLRQWPEIVRNQPVLARPFRMPFTHHRISVAGMIFSRKRIWRPRAVRDSAVGMKEAFDLYSPEIDADPFPYYAILRKQYPCYWIESASLWILSRYDDIVQVAQDWETFSSSQGNMIDELLGRAGATLGTTDPPRHDRLRALSQAAFTRKNIQHLIAPTLEIADRALACVTQSGQLEFINAYSSQITVGLLFRSMGLAARDHADIRRKVILAVSTDK